MLSKGNMAGLRFGFSGYRGGYFAPSGVLSPRCASLVGNPFAIS